MTAGTANPYPFWAPNAYLDPVALGLIRDPKTFRGKPKVPASPADQEAFVRLWTQAGVYLRGDRENESANCPFHDDRHRSLSVDVEHAVFYCHATTCKAQGGIGGLRKLLGEAPPPTCRPEDPLQADMSAVGCTAVRWSAALRSLGRDEEAAAVEACGQEYSAYYCPGERRNVAFPHSCHRRNCPVCGPRRLELALKAGLARLPERLNVYRLAVAESVCLDEAGTLLPAVRRHVHQWRRQRGLSGLYAALLDFDGDRLGAHVLLAVAAGEAEKAVSGRQVRVVEVVAEDLPREYLPRVWSNEFRREADAWVGPDEFAAFDAATRGRRKFQEAGKFLIRHARAEEAPPAEGEGEAPDEVPSRRRTPWSGGSGPRPQGRPRCPHCGGGLDYRGRLPATGVARDPDGGWTWGAPPSERAAA